MNKVGCTTPFGINLDHICTDLETSRKAKEIYDKRHHKTYQFKNCPYPCKFIKSMVSPFKKRNGSSESQLNFEKYVKVTRAIYSYTGLELMAEFGGYVGLFLGFSVFHLSQAIDKILDIIMRQ